MLSYYKDTREVTKDLNVSRMDTLIKLSQPKKGDTLFNLFLVAVELDGRLVFNARYPSINYGAKLKSKLTGATYYFYSSKKVYKTDQVDRCGGTVADAWAKELNLSVNSFAVANGYHGTNDFYSADITELNSLCDYKEHKEGIRDYIQVGDEEEIERRMSLKGYFTRQIRKEKIDCLEL